MSRLYTVYINKLGRGNFRKFNLQKILSPFSDANDNFSICACSGVLAASDAFSQVPPIIYPLSDANSIYIEYAFDMGDFLVGAYFCTLIERI